MCKFQLTGFSNIVYTALNMQKRLVTAQYFSADLCCNLIEKYKLKHVFLLPPHITLLVESSRFHTTDFSSLTVVTSGGLMLTKQMRITLKSKLPNADFVFAFGMTEVGGIVCETYSGDTISSSVGKPSPNTQIKILIDDGSIGDLYEIGEILVKKPMKFLGYIGTRHPTILDSGESMKLCKAIRYLF
jgi:4-coumarate--CoA ligase